MFVFYEIHWIWSESLVKNLWFNRALLNKWNENEFIIGFISKRLWATLIVEWLVRCARCFLFVAFNFVISSSSSSLSFFFSFQLSIFTSHRRVTQQCSLIINKKNCSGRKIRIEPHIWGFESVLCVYEFNVFSIWRCIRNKVVSNNIRMHNIVYSLLENVSVYSEIIFSCCISTTREQSV